MQTHSAGRSHVLNDPKETSPAPRHCDAAIRCHELVSWRSSSAPMRGQNEAAEAHHPDLRLRNCMAACLLCAATEQPLKRVGFLAGQSPCPLKPDNIIIRRLGELGWIEGQNFILDCVSAVGRADRVPALARELVSRHPDVLTAGFWNFISALKQETTTIPLSCFPDGSPYGWVS